MNSRKQKRQVKPKNHRITDNVGWKGCNYIPLFGWIDCYFCFKWLKVYCNPLHCKLNRQIKSKIDDLNGNFFKHVLNTKFSLVPMTMFFFCDDYVYLFVYVCTRWFCLLYFSSSALRSSGFVRCAFKIVELALRHTSSPCNTKALFQLHAQSKFIFIWLSCGYMAQAYILIHISNISSS